MNDIDLCARPINESGGISLFADDTKVYATEPSKLQTCLTQLGDWFQNRQLSLSSEICFLLTISKSNENPAPYIFNLNSSTISVTNEMKDLGIIVSDKLKWSNHINSIYNKGKIPSYYILKFTKTRNIWTLLSLFITYIRPKLEYNTAVWSPHLKKDIQKIEKIQKDYTRYAFKRCSIPYSDYLDRLYKLDLHSLEYRRTEFDLIFLYKIINGLCGLNFNEYYQYRSQPYALRNKSIQIETKHHSNNYLWQNNFFTRSTKLWNRLPIEIQTSNNLSSFRKNLKEYNLNQITNLAYPRW